MKDRLAEVRPRIGLKVRNQKIHKDPHLGWNVSSIGKHRGDSQRKLPIWQHSNQATTAQIGCGQEHRTEHQSQTMTCRLDEDFAVVGNQSARDLDQRLEGWAFEPPSGRSRVVGIEQALMLL